MSKKTNAAKRERPRKHYRKPRNNRTTNPARTTGILSNAALTECVESLAFGQLGCALIRAIGIKPIDLLTVPAHDQKEDQEATS